MENENGLQLFNNEEFGQVRVIILDGKLYFNLSDISFGLGYIKKNSQGKEYLRKERVEKVVKSLEIKGVSTVDTNIKMIEINKELDFEFIYISESDFYDFALEAGTDISRKFRKWITNDVLPTIRKTGGYVNNDDLFVNTYLPFADDNTKMLFKTTLTTVRKQNEIIESQKKEIQDKNKVIEYKENVIVGLVDEVSLAEQRQILNRVVRKVPKYQERWKELYKNFEMKNHINLNKRFESYNENHKPKIKNKLDYVDKVLNQIPELYNIACKLYENDVNELIQEIYNLQYK